MDEVKNPMFTQLLKWKAKIECDKLEKAILEQNNFEIENTIMYKILTYMLSEENVSFKKILEKDDILYRARIFDIGDNSNFKKLDGEGKGFNKIESKEPPLQISADGRNNLKGVSYLYLSDDKYTAISETKPSRGQYVSIAKFITNKPLRIFNLCDDDKVNGIRDALTSIELAPLDLSEAITNIMKFYYSPFDKKKGYVVTQYISDYIRKFGYDGVCYKSFISDGRNYTVFNSCENNIRFSDSELVFVEDINLSLVRLNNFEKIKNNNIKMSFEENDYKYAREKIYNKMKSDKNMEDNTNGKIKNADC